MEAIELTSDITDDVLQNNCIILRGVYCKSEYSPNKKQGHIELTVLGKSYLSVDTWVLQDYPDGPENLSPLLFHPLLFFPGTEWKLKVTCGCAVYLVVELIRAEELTGIEEESRMIQRRTGFFSLMAQPTDVVWYPADNRVVEMVYGL